MFRLEVVNQRIRVVLSEAGAEATDEQLAK